MITLSSRQVITSRQLLYILLVATFPTEGILLPGPIIRQFGKDAIWAVLLGAIYAVGPLLLSLSIVRHTKGTSLIDVMHGRVRLFGRGLLLLFGLALLGPSVTIWGGYVQLLHVDLLVSTPAWAILLAALAIVIYGITGGLEVVSRVSELFVPPALVAVFLMWIAAIPWYHVGHLLPLLPQQLNVLMVGAYQPFTFLAEIAFGSYLGTFVKDPDGVIRALSLALALNALVLMFQVMMPLLMFTGPHARILALPPVIAVRAIHFGFLIDRLDTLVLPAWVLLVSLKLMVWALAGGNMIADALGIQHWRIVGQAGVSATALWSLRLHSLGDVEKALWYVWFATALPLILALLVAFTLMYKLGRKKLPSRA